MSLSPQQNPSSPPPPSPPPPRVDPLDAFTLVIRLFGFLALSALTVTYLFQKRWMFALAFGFVALLIQWRAIALIHRLREDALARMEAEAAASSAAAVSAAPAETPEKAP